MKLSKLFIVICLFVSFFFYCGIGFAEEGKKFDYSKSNLASFGIPDWSGLEPYRVFFMDRINELPGKETQIEKYNTSTGILMVSKYNGEVYNISFDKDKMIPLDVNLVDFNRNGQFVKVAGDLEFEIPKWLLNK